MNRTRAVEIRSQAVSPVSIFMEGRDSATPVSGVFRRRVAKRTASMFCGIDGRRDARRRLGGQRAAADVDGEVSWEDLAHVEDGLDAALERAIELGALA